MNDSQLRQDILDLFQWDPRIEPTHVRVAVERGFVTLTGSVASEEERAAIEYAARHVDGVRGITERIEVSLMKAGITSYFGAPATADTD